MANEEAFTLDGLALNDGTTFGVTNVSWPPPRQRQDWIGAADSETQLLFRNPLHENRKVTLRIAVIPQSTMDLALAKIAQVLDKLQKASQYTDGIGLVWTPATSSLSCTFDVLSGEITDLPIDWESGWLAKAPEFTIELTCKPYWRGTETLTSTPSTSTPFVTLEVASVTGDIPALGRLIVTDTASQSRRHVEWGLEGPLTYNNSTSLIIDSDNLVTSGFAGTQEVGPSGAYDPNASGNNAVLAFLYTNTMVAVAGTGDLTHVGTFRVKARAYTALGTQLRMTYKVGDGPLTSNAWATSTLESQWTELDLGTITIPAVVSGTQRWTGRIDAYNATTIGNVHLDYLLLIPVSDGYGKARATYAYAPGVVVGQDSFTSTTAGNALNGTTAALGGTWATSGDATDFVFADDLSGEQIKRTTTASETTGRFAILGSTSFTDVQVEATTVLFGTASPPSNRYSGGVVARWVDSSNFIRAYVSAVSGATFSLQQVVAGTGTILGSVNVPFNPTNGAGSYYTIRLIAFASGRIIATAFHLNSGSSQTLEASATVTATGGALQTGKPGLFDVNSGGSNHTRYYDSVAVLTPAAEPIALYSGRNMQIRYDDTIRQDSTGTYTGRPASYRGGRFLLPVGTSRVFVKARRNDIEAAADDQVTDATQIQIGWTPRGLAVPR